MTAIPTSCHFDNLRKVFSFHTKRMRALIFFVGFFAWAGVRSGHAANVVAGSGELRAVRRDLWVSARLHAAKKGSAYRDKLAVAGGNAPYFFSISRGTLPRGLSLNRRTGAISGTPTATGSSVFSVVVRDTEGRVGRRWLSLVVANASLSVHPTITISPLGTNIVSGGKQQFTSTLRETNDTAVKWSATAGTISDSGLFNAPSVSSKITIAVRTASVADPRLEATAEITVMPPVPVPPPVEASSGPDNRYCSAGDEPTFGAMDGPANLPEKCINTALSNTPSSGKQTLVPAGGNLNGALEAASCGDVILVQAGATFKGPITLPAKNCDAAHWITVRSSAPDSSLPGEGKRLTPCYAGISSLPGRPTYFCPSPKNVMAKIEIASGGGAITAAPDASYYRIIGLEVTRKAGTGIAFGLVKLSAADHLIFDRVWIHGTALDETTRGIYLGDSTNVAVVDSYLNDFHCISRTGSCTDAQTINGGNSLFPTGPYKIVNNFLEAAAENILLGGAKGATVPADIEIRRNHMFKPMIWKRGNLNFIGKSFIVKNLFEIKNAERLLLEGNEMQNSWGGFSQQGWGIVITPRGSWAAARDITIRYNRISHVGAAFQICASQQKESNGTMEDSLASERLSIHDVTVEDMSAKAYDGSGVGFQLSSGFTVNSPLNNVTINHVTMITDSTHTLMIIGASRKNPVLPFNITFTNNLAVAGQYSVWSTGGAIGTCAKSAQPLITFNHCWGSYTVTNNAIIAYPNGQGPWPEGNFFPGTSAGVGFTNFNKGAGGNYQLDALSPYANMSIPDHADLGADIVTLNAEIAGVK